MEGVVAEAAREATPEETPLLCADADAAARLSLPQKAAYGVGHVFNDVCAAIWFSYTLLFLQEVLGMAPVLAGSMLLIGQRPPYSLSMKLIKLITCYDNNVVIELQFFLLSS